MIVPKPRNGVVELSVEGVTLRFGGVTALDDVRFRVAPGAVHALIGPTGAGKSSCLDVISGLRRPLMGAVRYGERLLTLQRPHRLAALGVGRSFQAVAPAPGSTVRDAVLLGRHALTTGGFLAGGLRLGRRTARRHVERVEEICGVLGVAEHLDAPVDELPRGVAKRVDIARALAVEPTLLLLDEPAARLDATGSTELAGTIRELRDALGISVLLGARELGPLAEVTDRVSVLDRGRVVAEGPPAGVRAETVRDRPGGAGDSGAGDSGAGDSGAGYRVGS